MPSKINTIYKTTKEHNIPDCEFCHTGIENKKEHEYCYLLKERKVILKDGRKITDWKLGDEELPVYRGILIGHPFKAKGEWDIVLRFNEEGNPYINVPGQSQFAGDYEVSME